MSARRSCILGYPKCAHDDSDQPVRMNRLIGIFAVRTFSVTFSHVASHLTHNVKHYDQVVNAGTDQTAHSIVWPGPSLPV